MEVVADSVGSLGVLIAGVVTVTTHWPYADVVVAVLVAIWVLPRAISLARDALRILSESSPTHIDVEELRTALGALDGVTEVHDLHVWTLSPGKDMCTAHLTSAGDSARVLQDGRHTTQEAPIGLVRIRHRAETLPAVSAQLVQPAVVAGAGIRVGHDGLVVSLVVGLMAGESLLGQGCPGHQR
jgi:Co/Zn/Cd efflux system component